MISIRTAVLSFGIVFVPLRSLAEISNFSVAVPEAQERRFALRRRVVVEESGRPAAGVRIVLPKLRRGTLTDSAGEYRMDGLTFTSRYVEHPVQALRLGYIPEIRELRLRDLGGGTCIKCEWRNDTTLVLNFYLRDAPVELEH